MFYLSFLIYYLIFLFIIISSYYYIDLFTSKNEFSKEDVLGLSNFIKSIPLQIFENLSPFSFLSSFILSAIFGSFISILFSGWIINSALPIIVLYFLFSYLEKIFKSRITYVSASAKDTFIYLFVKTNRTVNFGFGTALLTGFTFKQLSPDYSTELGPLLFLINFIAAIVFLVLIFKSIIEKENETSRNLS